MTERKLAVVLPLADGASPVSEVLEMMRHGGAGAVILETGQADSPFELHRVEGLRAALASDPAALFGDAAGGIAIPRLTTKAAGASGLDLSDLKAQWVEQAFLDVEQPAAVAAVARTMSRAARHLLAQQR